MVAASRRAGFQPTTTRAGDGITGPCPCCGGTDRVWIGSLPDGGPPAGADNNSGPATRRRTTRSCGRARQPAGAWSPPSRP